MKFGKFLKTVRIFSGQTPPPTTVVAVDNTAYVISTYQTPKNELLPVNHFEVRKRQAEPCDFELSENKSSININKSKK